MLFTDCLVSDKKATWHTYYDRQRGIYDVIARSEDGREEKLLIRAPTAEWDKGHRSCPERNDLTVKDGCFFVEEETEKRRHMCVLAHVGSFIPKTAVNYVVVYSTFDLEWVVIDFSGIPGGMMVVEELHMFAYARLLDCSCDYKVGRRWSFQKDIATYTPDGLYAYGEKYPDCPGLIQLPSPVPEGWNPWIQIASLPRYLSTPQV